MNSNESSNSEEIETSGGDIWRRHLGGDIWEETSGRRHLGGDIWEETSGRRHLGDIWETSEETHSIPLGQYEKIKDDYLRLAADFENFKKRTEKEKSMSTVTSLSIIISSLLPLIDNFEISMSQEDTPTEIEALYKMAQAFLDTFNVKEVPGIGESFDPNYQCHWLVFA